MPCAFDSVRETSTLGYLETSGIAVEYAESVTYSWYASSIRMTVSGDA